MQKSTLHTEAGMMEFGRELARGLELPCAIELVGDVGAGKTTLVRGLAAGLGVAETVASPSFTISRAYDFDGGRLVHYDFYRLEDPGLMAEDLADSLGDERTVTAVEWGESVADLLPEGHVRVEISLNEDGSRTVMLCGARAA